MDPPYLSALKGEYGVTKMGWFKNYQAKYIVPGKFKPVIHVIGFVCIVGYALEYSHLRGALFTPPSPRASTFPGATRRLAAPAGAC